MITLRHHRGRSGKSVYEWRVYRSGEINGKPFNIQLGKYRTREEAEKAVIHFRENDERIDALRLIRAAKQGESECDGH